MFIQCVIFNLCIDAHRSVISFGDGLFTWNRSVLLHHISFFGVCQVRSNGVDACTGRHFCLVSKTFLRGHHSSIQINRAHNLSPEKSVPAVSVALVLFTASSASTSCETKHIKKPFQGFVQKSWGLTISSFRSRTFLTSFSFLSVRLEWTTRLPVYTHCMIASVRQRYDQQNLKEKGSELRQHT